MLRLGTGLYLLIRCNDCLLILQFNLFDQLRWGQHTVFEALPQSPKDLGRVEERDWKSIDSMHRQVVPIELEGIERELEVGCASRGDCDTTRC